MHTGRQDYVRLERQLSIRPNGRPDALLGQLGDRLLGAGVVDQRLAVGGSGDEGGDSAIVERARQATGELVQAGHGVVGEEWVDAAGEGEVVTQAVS